MKNGVNRALVAKKKFFNYAAKSLKSYGGGNSQFSHILFVLLMVLTFGVGNAWAVEMSASGSQLPTSAASGKYYVYNPSSSCFLTKTGITTSVDEAFLFTVKTYANGTIDINYQDNNCTCYPCLETVDMEGAPTWTANGASSPWTLNTPSTRTYTNSYYLVKEQSSYETCLSVMMSTLMTNFLMVAGDGEEWIFITQDNYDAVLTDLTPRVVDDGFYYLYNTQAGSYFKKGAGSSSMNADVQQATMCYIKKVGPAYTIAYVTNQSYLRWLGMSTSISEYNATTNAYTKFQIERTGEEGSYQYTFHLNWQSTERYLKGSATGLTASTTDDANCKWELKTPAEFKAAVTATATWTGDNYFNNMATTAASQKVYYLYNPAIKMFIKKDRGRTSDPTLAEPFYVKASGGKYSIAQAKSGSVTYLTPGSTSMSSSSVSLTLAPTTISGKTVYAISTDANQYLSSLRNGTSDSYIYVKNITPNASTFPYDATVAANDVNSLWVLIAQEEHDLTAPTLGANSTYPWVDDAENGMDGDGLYCLYNPASNRFLGTYRTLTNVARDAGVYFIKETKDIMDNTVYHISFADLSSGTVANYINPSSSTWNTTSSDVTISTIGSSNKVRLYNDLMGVQQAYLTTYKSNATAYDLSVGTVKNNYVYTPDAWSEWVLIPYATVESNIASNPTGDDPMLQYAVVPEEGKQYFIYNVGWRQFVKLESLTGDLTKALPCTMGENSISIPRSLGPAYFAAKSSGYATSAYTIAWDRIGSDPATPIYYVYHENGEQDLHVAVSTKLNYSSENYYGAVPFDATNRPAGISDKFKWAFLASYNMYYSASTEIYAGEGDVYVYFGTPSVSASTGVIAEGSLLESIVKTATFMAMPETDYQFMGWKIDPDGEFVSTDMMYQYELTVSSMDSDHPDNVTLYAYFEKYDAELYNESGILVKDGDNDGFASLSSAISAASAGYTIKLKRHINLAEALTVNKAITIDFNGYTISGSANNLLTITVDASETVTFTDNSTAHNGGVDMYNNVDSDPGTRNALKVTAGTLVVNSGYYSAELRNAYAKGTPYCLNGKARVNGGYFRAVTSRVAGSVLFTNYKPIFDGTTVKLFGGYFACGVNDLEENPNYTNNVANISNHTGSGVEAITSEDATYNITLRNISDAADVVATADGKNFSSLADAIAYANNNADTEMSIRLAKDCQLEAGNYVIPEKATLIVPYSSLHTEPLVACPLLNNSRLPNGAYRTLTLEEGVRIDVYGAIELGGCAYSYGNGATGTGRPNSDYGHLVMDTTSQIILNNGANLRAWGFVTGKGTIDVRRGGRVDEMFQVYDFKGGRGTLAMYENGGHKAFPMNQYFIQNVEVKTTYRPGSKLYTTMSAVNVGISVKIIGVDTDGAALFKMDENDDSEDTWVCKWYNPNTDQQVYDINNSASISNLFLPLSSVIGVQGADFDSKDYILPITNNFKIHVLAGQINITQDVAFLPGAELEINKLCYGKIKANTTTYFYDSEEWGAYVYNGAYASKIKYRPGGLQFNRDITAAGVKDAQMNIHGTLEVDGGFRTTEGGANIFSTNADAGTVSFTANSLTTYTDETLDTWTGQTYYPATIDNDYKASAEPHYAALPAYPAQLQNAEGFTSTTTAAVGDNEGKSFCYINNEWRLLTDEDCMVTDGDNYYIKPQEYIQLSSNTEDENHLYHAAGDASRDFIITLDADGNCQWWEVEDVPGHPELKHSIHPENDVYYYYDAEIYGTWLEKRFNITWKDWDGSKLTFVNTENQVQDHYELRYGSMPQWLGSIPQREMSAYYTYDFAGWTPALAPVTADATYTAQYNQTDRKYLISFKGGDIDTTEYKKMGDMPVIPTPPAGKEWTPAVSPVTGDANYTLQDKNNDGPFTITFVNWNGTSLQSGSVALGVIPVYTGSVPVKPSLGDENYTFVGWTPEVVAATADAVYMAKYEVEHISGLIVSDEETINNEREVSELRVTTTGTLIISNTGSVKTDNFILESTTNESGQVVGAPLKVNGKAYFDVQFNGNAGTANRTWYAIAVPWEVDAENGILWKEGDRKLVLGRDFDLVWYDGEERAAHGDGYACWRYLENESDKMMHPGKMYMMYFGSQFKTVRFEKNSGKPIIYTVEGSGAVTSVSTYEEQTNNTGKDANWNGIANPAVYHATLGVTTDFAQVLGNGSLDAYFANPEAPVYTTIDMSNYQFVVGKPAFVQATTDNQSIVVSSVIANAALAPKHERTNNLPEGIMARYALHIALEGHATTDNLFIQVTEEEKADTYVIGQDLAKGGVAKTIPQLWVNRYNSKLSVNTQALTNDAAEYPLTLFAPVAGEYQISNVQSQMSNEDYTLYLTLNGEAIWNLSNSDYTFSLPQGNTTEYGLRVSAKVPEVATGIDEAIVDANGETQKVIINNQVFIIRGNNIYSVDGQMVK